MKREIMPGGELTPPNQIEIDYFETEGDIAKLVTVFYHFRCDDPVVRDIQPAAIGHLSLFPRGKGKMFLPDGGHDTSQEVNLLTPLSCALPIEVDGPFHAVGAALSPLGWAALTGLHAQGHANRLYKAADWMDPEIEDIGTGLCAAYRDGTASAADMVEALTGFILTRAKLPRPRHLQLMASVGDWLAGQMLPAVEDLYAASTFSRRQTQRLVEQYFGVPPVTLRRKYRALRAAAALSRPVLSAEEEAVIYDAFYDQPHMIHEIREFVGRTPARLCDDGSPYLKELIDKKNLRELGRG
ncbi:helix-turn-helix domain-containing protein [Aurantiacibacter rhizosphaerae]|uniref:Helix-turn-helix domain-containing protein n=1 Tax=Aurantiacibacter rhizosphaerae TaxID=2691582 RepID=A0A844XA33_9SPHN|nr:helix-turn-helix domain-containing protein [Aurantiacibacter rhizosphaerae]MWV26395.1 helix-turn-helix domain-containing protein [Aurantiacibacter rhizosphaerae]